LNFRFTAFSEVRQETFCRFIADSSSPAAILAQLLINRKGKRTAKVSTKGKPAPEPEREPERRRSRSRNIRLRTQEYVRQQELKRQQEFVQKIIADHAKASRDLDDFRRTQNLEHLLNAARILEKSYRRFLENDDFWIQLANLPDMLQEEDQKAGVEELLRSFDSFLAREERQLVQDAHLPRDEVVRLLDAVNEAIDDRKLAVRMVRFMPNRDAIENLRARCKGLQEALRTVQREISTVLASNEPPPDANPRRYSWVHVVHRSILCLGGVGVAAANLYQGDPTGIELTASAVGGVIALVQQVSPDRLDTIVKVIGSEFGSKAKEVGGWFQKKIRGD
jgi:hypothetical protein